MLRAQLTRIDEESEQRAVRDAQLCRTMYEQMERLARMNSTLLSRCQGGRPSSHELIDEKSQHANNADRGAECVDDDAEDGEDGGGSCALSLPANTDYLQSLVVQQAKAIHNLREQRKTMVPLVPLQGVKEIFVHDEEANAENSEHERYEGHDQRYKPTPVPMKQQQRRQQLQRLPLTSLRAKVAAQERQMLTLRRHIARLEDQLTSVLEEKRRVVQQYQRIAKTQQSQLKKYFAVIQQQNETKHALEYKLQEVVTPYVAVLENKLVTLARAFDRRGQPRDVNTCA